MSDPIFAAVMTGVVLFIAVLAVIGYHQWKTVFGPGIDRAWRLGSRGIGNDQR